MKLAAVLMTSLATALTPLSGIAADAPQKHPYYQHALTDLRAARWHIEHRAGNARVSADEDAAIKQIDQVIVDIKRAAIDDDKRLSEQPPVDARGDPHGNLHRAEALLKEAHSEIAREEDDPSARGLRDTAIRHLDDALRATQKAIEAAQTR
jgi:hypothetical protein